MRDDAHQDGAVALLLGQPGRGKSDDDGVVPGQHEVDHDDLEKGGERFRGEDVHMFQHAHL